MAYKKEDKQRFLEVLAKKNYHIGKTCTAFDISRGTFYLWEKESWFSEAIAWMKEEDLDDAEDTLRRLRKGVPKLDKDGNFEGWVIKPEPSATYFFLKTQGKRRGYIERTENEQIGDQHITITKRVIGG